MPFPLTPNDIDEAAATATDPEPWSLAAVFFRLASRDGESKEKAEAWQLLGVALNLHFNPGDVARPFGNVSHGPGHEFLSVPQAENFEQLAPLIRTSDIRARLADLAWMRKRSSPDMARIAVGAYVEAARAVEHPREWSACIRPIERAARLGRSLGIADKSFAAVSDLLIAMLDRHKGEDPLFLSGEIIRLLLEFDLGEPPKRIQYASRAADRARDSKNFHVCRYYLELLSKLHAREKDDASKDVSLRGIAHTFELEADDRQACGHSLAAVHFLNQAITAHRRVSGGAAFVEAIRPRLQRAERAAIREFKPIENQFDLGEEVVNSKQKIAGKTKRDAILHLAHMPRIASVKSIKSSVLKIASLTPLSSIMGHSNVDQEGRTIGFTPGLESEDEEQAVFARMVEFMRHHRLGAIQGRIIPALQQIHIEHSITMEDMAGLARYSPFVPPGREEIFARGLHAGFSFDFLTATHLLVPQFENSIRHLLNERGVITTKIDRDGIQREIDLNELVVDRRVFDILSEDVVFHIRSLLTDNRGPNFRNLLAHGLLDDAAFSSIEAVYAWWLTLALCFFTPMVTGKPSASEKDEGQA